MKYEEMLASQTELAHFNANHDKLGRFAKKVGGAVSSAKSSMSPRGKQVAKRAAAAAGVMAGVSALATVGNAIGAQGALDALGFGDKLLVSQVVKAGTVQAGKVAAASALAVIGGHMAADYMKGNKKSSKNSDSK